VVDDAMIGVDTLAEGPKGMLHAGASLAYTHDPLVLVGAGETVYGVVRNRMTTELAGAWQPGRALTLRASIPVVGDWGTQNDALAADGVGLGDLWLGAALGTPRLGPIRLGAAVDLAVPVGTTDAWRGEGTVRVVPGFLAEMRAGRFRLAANSTIVLRPPVDTDTGLTVGTELCANGGVAWEVWRERARVSLALVTRTGLTSDGAGANSRELVGGLQVEGGRSLRFDTWVGRGLSIGYGASDYRFGLGLTAHKPRKVVVHPPEPDPAPAPARPIGREIEIQSLEDLPDVRPPRTIALARIQEDQIVIRDPVQFELGTDHILPESLPTIHEVAAILRDHPEILQVVIEGHASEEGSFIYNYDLSLRRASAMFKELVLAGVHPDRLACRSMGEVEPVAPGTEESDLARSRRVVFHITRRLEPGEVPPTYSRDILIPWTGEAATIPEAPVIELPPTERAPGTRPPEDDTVDPDIFDDEGEP
jgi:outer membrane protein OmpA-like peptidoglycan-associated protein